MLSEFDDNFSKLQDAILNVVVEKHNPNAVKVEFRPKLKEIINQKQTAYKVSDERLIETNSAYITNYGPLEQEAKTAELSKSYSTSTTIETSSSLGFSGSVTVTTGGGLDLGILSVSSEVSVQAGVSSESSTSKSNTTSVEVSVTIPSQTVKVQPFSKAKITNNFYSNEATITYLIDAELDASASLTVHFNESYAKECEHLYWVIVCPPISTSYFFGTSNETFSIISDYVATHSMPDLDDVQIVIVNGKYVIRNIPVVIKRKGYHGEVVIGDQESLITKT